MNLDITTRSKSIKSKTNYIEMKISSMNKNINKNNMEKDFIQTEEVLKNNVSKKKPTPESEIVLKKFNFWKN